MPLAPFNTIDLADIAFGSNTTVVYLASSADTGTLTVSDGTHTANIALLGQYSPDVLHDSERRSRWHRGGRSGAQRLGLVEWRIFLADYRYPIADYYLTAKFSLTGRTRPATRGLTKSTMCGTRLPTRTTRYRTRPLSTSSARLRRSSRRPARYLSLAAMRARMGSVNKGIPNTNIFDLTTNSLTPSPSGPMAFARWYPTLITLDTGQLLILGGADIDGNGVGTPEIFTPGAGWRTLTGAYIAEMAAGTGYYYPRTWQASNGRVITVAADGHGHLRDRSLRKWPSQRDRTGSGRVLILMSRRSCSPRINA